MAETQSLGEYYTVPVILSFDGVDKQVNSNLGKAFGRTGIGSKAGKDFAQSFGDAVEADMKRLFDTQEKLANRAADATSKLKVAQAGYNDLVEQGVRAGKRYEAAKAAVEKATRDEARAIRQSTDALKDYEKAARDAEGAGEKASGGFLSGLRGAVGGAAEKGSDAASSFAEGFAGSSALLRLGSAGGPVGIALAAAGLVGGGLLVQNVLAGMERETSRDLIQAQLGIDEPTMRRLAEASGRAYANNFGASVEEEMDVAKRAVQGGLLDPTASAADMQPVIEQLTAVNQLIGGDLTSTTKAASVLIRNGLAANATEAFDIIARGYQMSGDLGDDFLDSLSEYGSGWKNAGLTAQQALALIQQSVDMGVDNTDRGADALREFGRRVTEEGDTMVAVLDNIGLNGSAMMDAFKQGGPAAFEAFDATFDAIRQIEDPVRRNQAAMALLGDTAGDFIGTFAQWDPSKAVNDFGAIDGAAQQASDTMGTNVVGSFASARRDIEVAVDGAQDKLADAFGPSLQRIADFAGEHTDDIASSFVSMAQVTIKSTGLLMEGFGQIAGGLGNVVGGILKSGAALQRLTGDSETADQWDREAEAAFGWGETMQALGRELQTSAEGLDSWKDSLGNTATESDNAATSVGDLSSGLAGLPGQKDIKVNVTDAQGNPLSIGGAGFAPLTGNPNASLFGGSGATAPAFGPSSNSIGNAGSTPFDWDAVAAKESSGNWQDNNSGGHTTSSGAPRGGLQITDGTWKAFGGEEFAPTANLATREQQIMVAERIAWTGHNGTKPQGLGAWEVITQGKVPGVTASTPQPTAAPVTTAGAVTPNQSLIGTPIYTGGTTSDTGGGVVPGIAALQQAVKSQFPSATISNDYRKPDGFNEHSSGTAVDIAVNPGGTLGIKTPEGQALGSQINTWLLQNAGALGLQYTIWQGKNWRPDGSSSANGGQGITGGHWDHVHARVSADAAAQLSGLAPPTTSAGTSPFPSAAAASPFSSSGSDLGVTGPGSQSLTNAFGPDYKPGVGTPGFDESGEPGYYQPDPRQVAQADRRAQDTQQAITDADQAILDAKEARAALEKDLTATAEDRAKADRAITDAETRAARAREDATWASQDAAEARKGQFTRAQKADKSTTGKGAGGSQFGELGSIASSFLSETFGFDGNFLPALDSLMPVQMAGTLLNFLAPQMQALSDPAAAAGSGASSAGFTATSGSPFGMADVAVPPMPPPGVHAGSSDAPGPSQPITIDQSINGNVGWDPAQVNKQRDEGLARAKARILTGS